MRCIAQRAASVAHFSDERTCDLLTSVGEAAMNAVVHGGGGHGRVYVEPHEAVQVWISDNGHGIEMESLHQATLQRGFTTAGSFGHGFWMILRTVDKVWLLTGPTGTTVVLEERREPSDPFWMDDAISSESPAASM
jgi:anti-sigma regulatory factor (Ser/Thr protein kinase)